MTTIILHIEASSGICSVALSQDGHIFFERVNREEMSHAKVLAPFVEEALQTADEQGAKAAAVTVGVILSWSARPRSVIPFIMDRPFIWAITDLENSTSPLFMGLLESP